MPWIFPKNHNEETVLEYAGFVYLITNLISGRKYVGRKFFYASKKGGGAKISNWESYYGSSRYLSEDIKLFGKDAFERRILSLHKTRQETCFAEVREQFKRNVLERQMTVTMDDGTKVREREYYNANIASKWFIQSPQERSAKNAKIDDSQALEIRSSNDTLRDISLKYDISVPYASYVKRGLTHRWLD